MFRSLNYSTFCEKSFDMIFKEENCVWKHYNKWNDFEEYPLGTPIKTLTKKEFKEYYKNRKFNNKFEELIK